MKKAVGYGKDNTLSHIRDFFRLWSKTVFSLCPGAQHKNGKHTHKKECCEPCSVGEQCHAIHTVADDHFKEHVCQNRENGQKSMLEPCKEQCINIFCQHGSSNKLQEGIFQNADEEKQIRKDTKNQQYNQGASCFSCIMNTSGMDGSSGNDEEQVKQPTQPDKNI